MTTAMTTATTSATTMVSKLFTRELPCLTETMMVEIALVSQEPPYLIFLCRRVGLHLLGRRLHVMVCRTMLPFTLVAGILMEALGWSQQKDMVVQVLPEKKSNRQLPGLKPVLVFRSPR
ncbi:hypothetical protein L873DRAFT_1478536 [Choiromyces venosus 120613-1]|uniref:Uncharacterized protein n=1 Tax=Choiromyces venosus 120613-1 TaxID=1336337 RepID=A0A3N4JAK6_9PEZI|nr:hypothetical protein L873DRAFT_1478536 [Choiromyces venosus 120613-1]